jgi:hypothetical protein
MPGFALPDGRAISEKLYHFSPIGAGDSRAACDARSGQPRLWLSCHQSRRVTHFRRRSTGGFFSLLMSCAGYPITLGDLSLMCGGLLGCHDYPEWMGRGAELLDLLIFLNAQPVAIQYGPPVPSHKVST